MKIKYITHAFRPDALALVRQAEEVLDRYAADGYTLTLRQLYYRLVTQNVIENTKPSYKKLGDIMTRARDAGLIDWSHLEDRHRNLVLPPSWTSLESIFQACLESYRNDLWMRQETRVFVFVEKDALINVIERACEPLRLPHLACKGYMSASETWSFAQRVLRNAKQGQRTVILHLGDHDPSGVDMTRDLRERLAVYTRSSPDIFVERIALTMEQIEDYDLPPNPAKLEDSRSTGYIEEFGDESWELDALEPDVIVSLIQRAVTYYVNLEAWETALQSEITDRVLLNKLVRDWGSHRPALDEYDMDTIVEQTDADQSMDILTLDD